MRYFMPDSIETTGGELNKRPVETIPTDMETDTHADEDVIDQQAGETYPEPVHPGVKPVKIVPDELADSIAYALDGSGPGPTNAKPNVPGHSIITEGTTGSGLDEEERIAG